MSGQPKWNAFRHRMDDENGEELILERVFGGDTLVQVARFLNTSRHTVYRYLHLDGERFKRYQLARIEGAGAMVERASEDLEDIAGDGDATSAQVTAVNNRARFMQWLAGKIDKETYGDIPKAAGLILNVNELHLSALQAHGGPAALTAGEIVVEEGEAEEIPLTLEDLI